MPGLERCCLHTITTKPWTLREAVDRYAEAGIKGMSVWQNALDTISPYEAGTRIRDNGMEVVSYVRGGFFPSVDLKKRNQALDENKRLIEQAATLGAPLLVLVCGADPGQPLSTSRQQIREGIEAVLPYAEELNVKLAIEPLHPMYAADRSAINTLGQANDLTESIASDYVGVALDVYHVWWDPELQNEIKRCGANGKLLAYHVCDWKVITNDMLNDRGLMGEGCINLKEIRSWVEDAGFQGFCEVEIFSTIHWAKNQQEFLNEIISSFIEKV